MTPTKDTRAIVHVAGPGIGTEQHCINCQTLVNSRNWDSNHWPAGATIANHGHGGWSVIHGQVNWNKYRLCRAR